MITKGIIMMIIGGIGVLISAFILIKVWMGKEKATQVEVASSLATVSEQADNKFTSEVILPTKSVVDSTVLLAANQELSEVEEPPVIDETILLKDEK
jgi:2-phospho-L-lactate transferase/gluconeogenesis factor (CofD/UPF0052 family)